MLELFANKSNIDIILLQETHFSQAGVERRRHYTTCFSEKEEIDEKTISSGVGIMIRSSLLGAVMEINPIDGRLMSITLRGTVHTTFINAYMEMAKKQEATTH